MKIRVLLSGGTIDKQYDEISGKLTFVKTHINQMLEDSRATVDVAVEQVLLVDSLDMTVKDRELLLEACRNSVEDKIVITHGTDTIVETAQMLGKNLRGKTVVLLGAMVPYSFGASDALFNLGSAISSVQLLPEGVYITMNGKIFSWNNVRKNKERGKFEVIQ